MTIDVNPDEPFHIVVNGTVLALSLDEMNELYQNDQIVDETLIWQEGLVEWMRLDTLLHTLEQQEGPVAPAPAVSEEMYYVLVAPEEVKQMSLDLLADAYRLDVIDDATLVWQPGFTEWLPISALLGEEDEHVSIAPSMPAPSPGGVPAPSMPAGIAPAPDFGFQASAGLDDSLAPAANWSSISQPERASPWYGRSLVALAALGAFFVSYRAGAVESAADELDQRAALSQVESKIGEPGLDTVQGLDRWLSQLTQTHGLDALSETDPIPAEKPKAKDAGDGANGDEKSNDDADQEKKASKDEKSGEEKSKKTAAKKAPSADAFTSSLKGKPRRPAPTTARSPVKRSTTKKWHGPTSGDPNDPMNGAL